MDLFFTPVIGKRAFLQEWHTKKITENKARNHDGATGIGIVHSLSDTIAFDFDDWEKCVILFTQLKIDIEKEIKGHCEIVSPKPNRKKVIFKKPKAHSLARIPIGKHLDLRAGPVYDLWHDSEYPKTEAFPLGGRYTLKNTAEPKELPAVLLEFWLACAKYKLENQSQGNELEKPLMLPNGNMSVIHIFNLTHSLEEVLQTCGFTQRGKSWRPPGSESGSYGVNVQLSYVNPWSVCYSHNASDTKLHRRCVDAFEIMAQYTHPNDSVEKAKAKFSAKQYKKLNAIDVETGEIMTITIDEFNNPDDTTDIDSTTIDVDINTSKAPVFTEDIVGGMPEPIKGMLHNFKQRIADPEPSMYCLAFMALHEVLLQGKFRTCDDGGVNNIYANGTRSGAGKDSNTNKASMFYFKALIERVTLSNEPGPRILQQLITPRVLKAWGGTAITQDMHDTTLPDIGPQPIGAAYFNAEATAFFDSLREGNSQMGKAVADLEINCWDGLHIAGIRVGKGPDSIKPTIREPNFSFLKLTQLDPFTKAFNRQLVIDGYYGRVIETYDPRSDDYQREFRDEYMERIANELSYSDEHFEFLLFASNFLAGMQHTITVKSTGKDGILSDWERKMWRPILDKRIKDSDLRAGVARIQQIAEKWVTFVTAWHYLWLLFKKQSTDHLVLKTNSKGVAVLLDGTGMEKYTIGIIKYLTQTKVFTLETYINTNAASRLDDGFERVWLRCVSKIKNKDSAKEFRNWLDINLVPLRMFYHSVNQAKEFSKIEPEKIKRLSRNWISDKGLVQISKIKGKKGNKVMTCLKP